MVRQVIHSVWEHVAAGQPDKPAVRTPAGEISYGALNEAANRLAFHLRDHGRVEPGTIVGLYLPAGISYVTAMLAVAKAGGVFLPLDPDVPSRRQQKFVAKARPALVLSDSEHSGAWASVDPHIPIVPLETVTSGPTANPPLAVTGEDASYIVFTSGSTGDPKAILGSQKGFSHFVHWELKEFGLDDRVRVSQLASPTFDVSLRDMFAPLVAGGTLCIPSSEIRSDIVRLLDWLHAESITLMHCVPSLFRTLLQELGRRPQPNALLTQLRHILLAGEPLYGVDVQRWWALLGEQTELVNLYGPSETTLAKAFYRIREVPQEPGRMLPIGNPLPNTALLILRDGELCDPGEIGEVYIRTPFMSKGYYGDPELTDEAFVQNPLTPDTPDRIYRTGDLGRYRPDRSVELLGRRDNQVKVKGIRVELEEIEQALLQHPSIEQAVVAAHSSADHEVYLTGYYIAKRAVTDAELRDHLRNWLPESMHPAFFVRRDAFPLNLHGKVLRRALPPPMELLYQQQPYIAPAGETEQELATIWDEVLQLGKIGVTHTFGELGGDSLKAIRLLPRISERFQVDVKLQELFPRGTIRHLATLITERLQLDEPSMPGVNGTIAPPTPEELQWLAE